MLVSLVFLHYVLKLNIRKMEEDGMENLVQDVKTNNKPLTTAETEYTQYT